MMQSFFQLQSIRPFSPVLALLCEFQLVGYISTFTVEVAITLLHIQDLLFIFHIYMKNNTRYHPKKDCNDA